MKLLLFSIFCMPLVVIVASGISAISLFKANQGSKSAFAFGFIISFLYYCLIYFSLATVNHTVEYSENGYAFAKFYFAIAMSVTLVLYPLLFVLLTTEKIGKYQINISTKNNVYGFQVGFALFTLLPLTITTIFMQMGAVQLALALFALVKNSSSVFNIYHDLTHPNLGLIAYIYLIVFTFFNTPIALTILNKHKMLGKMP